MKKIISLSVVLVMLLSVLSLGVSAEAIRGEWQVDGTSYTCPTEKDGNNFNYYALGTSDDIILMADVTLGLEHGFMFAVKDCDGDGIISVSIPERLSAIIGLGVGDDMPTFFVGEKVKVRKFRLCGLYEAGLEEIDARMALADRRQVQRLNGWAADEVSSIEIRMAPDASIERCCDRLEDIIIRTMEDDDPGLFVTHVKKLYGHLFDWLALLDFNVLMILALMVVVAGFNMISALLIILFEKISAIGLLKALGMTSPEVGKVFLLRAGRLVAKGMLWGNVVGISLCLLQKWTQAIKLDPGSYFVNAVPIDLNIGQLILLNICAAALLMLLISIATRFIARISPDRTMRVE